MQNLQHAQHSCQDCQVLFGSRVHNALAWMFINFHAKLQAAKIVHGGTTSHSESNQLLRTASMATNPCVSRCWLRQGHYVIMDNLHQSATHLGTSNHIWWNMHLMMHCRSYSLTAGQPRKLSIKLLFVHLRSATAAHSTSHVALALALANRINGLNTPKNSAFHPCQHSFLVIFVCPSRVKYQL